MEKMINIRLMNYIEANSLFSSFQYGFRRMRSAPDSLIRLASDISETFAAREELVCIFFDMKKAYDTMWRYGIIKAVHDIGIRGNMANFIMNLLKDRQFRTCVADVYSSLHEQQQGVP